MLSYFNKALFKTIDIKFALVGSLQCFSNHFIPIARQYQLGWGFRCRISSRHKMGSELMTQPLKSRHIILNALTGAAIAVILSMSDCEQYSCRYRNYFHLSLKLVHFDVLLPCRKNKSVRSPNEC